MPGYAWEIEPDPQLARVYIDILATIDAYERAARLAPKGSAIQRVAARKALDAKRTFERLRRDYEQLAIDVSAYATRAVRSRIDATAVRGPTSGNLKDAVISTPLYRSAVTRAYPSGAVGIGEFDRLNKVAANRRGAYWRAQEYGLPVDPDAKPIPGFFMPGRAAPDPGQFRVHPRFEASRGRGNPAMVRRRPLAARHFLRDGAREAVKEHRRKSATINRHAITSLP